ncbi:hypothetical protein HK100_004649 [Physocladia obscura]|uniref:Uncharacterized protein n=1 Tax=Physocladia obscura TaxID=109957 RepID=A0AAD5XGN0_9FUNG|nr:hypothetical protein HK100_004649 [Physocladia obscura]
MYVGTALRQFGPLSSVTQCGPDCKLTTECVFFAFAGNTTGQYSYGTCSLFAAGGDTSGPFDASVNDVCGYYGTEADAGAIFVSPSISSSISTISLSVPSSISSTTTVNTTIHTTSINTNTDNGNNTVAIAAATVFLVILVASAYAFFHVRRIRRIKNDQSDDRKSTPLLPTTNTTASTAVTRDDRTSFYSLDSDILRQAALPMSKHVESVMIANNVGLGVGGSKTMKKKSGMR